MQYSEVTKIRTNLYRANNRSYRLFGTGITPNGCWVINPKMVELVDIDVASGADVYGTESPIDDVTGTVAAGNQFVSYQS